MLDGDISVDLCDKLIVGNSQKILQVKALIRQIADTDFIVIIQGETGVGKNLVAQTLHLMSHRKDYSLVEVSCGAMPAELLESDLFGHEQESFALMKKGKLELAKNGTVLLDGIDELPPSLQSKVLHVIQDGQFSRLGGNHDVKLQCRILATSRQNLEQWVRGGIFREDLFYRLNIIPVRIPPLRERPEDIIPLFHFFAERFGQTGKSLLNKFGDVRIQDFLREYHWPGNVRELKEFVGHLMISDDWQVDWQVVKEELLSRGTKTGHSVMVKVLEFPPELYQSGISILSYFGTVVRKKYPNKNITVKIEQDGLTIRMVIETPEGEMEKIEKTLEQYGQVLFGYLDPNDFFYDKADVIELKQQLNIARVQLETQKEILVLKNGEISRLNQIVNFLETQHDKLNDILKSNLICPAHTSADWTAIIEHVTKEKNVIAEKALEILRDIIEKGITQSDEVSVKEALKTIKEQDPGIFRHVIDLVKGSVSGAAGNLIYTWIAPFLAVMPK